MDKKNTTTATNNETKAKTQTQPDEEIKSGGHYCPYCEHIEMQINDHFTHIEFFHPNEPLLVF